MKEWQDIDLNNPKAVLKQALDLYHPRITLASSFGLEDVVLIDMVTSIRSDARIFSLDTGRLNEETYQCAEKIRNRYKTNIDWYFPQFDSIQKLERGKGLYSFRDSTENRKECCGLRKVEPLNRALQDMDAWITGQRREQSVTRAELKVIETDTSHGDITKINPLANWSSEDVWNYVREHKLSYNTLHHRGYSSIGCAPCTRAIKTDEDERAGRWWWENPEHKECGLHTKEEDSK